MSISIVIAEDHALFRSGLRQLLSLRCDLEVIGEAGDGLSAVETTLRLRPDILLLDLAMPQLDGLDVIPQVRRGCPETAILVISMRATPEHLRAAFKAGAQGYLLKTADSEEFFFAIQSVLKGCRHISAELAEYVVDTYVKDAELSTEPLGQLTKREREVLILVAEGHTNKSIAEQLFISERTVNCHRTNFMHKLSVRNASEVTRFALQHGLIRIGGDS